MNVRDRIDYARWMVAAWIMPHWMLTMIAEALRETNRNAEVKF